MSWCLIDTSKFMISIHFMCMPVSEQRHQFMVPLPPLHITCEVTRWIGDTFTSWFGCWWQFRSTMLWSGRLTCLICWNWLSNLLCAGPGSGPDPEWYQQPFTRDPKIHESTVPGIHVRLVGLEPRSHPWDTNLSPFSVFNLWVVTVVTSQVRHGQLQLLLSEGKRTWQDHLVMWLVTPEPCWLLTPVAWCLLMHQHHHHTRTQPARRMVSIHHWQWHWSGAESGLSWKEMVLVNVAQL